MKTPATADQPRDHDGRFGPKPLREGVGVNLIRLSRISEVTEIAERMVSRRMADGTVRLAERADDVIYDLRHMLTSVPGERFDAHAEALEKTAERLSRLERVEDPWEASWETHTDLDESDFPALDSDGGGHYDREAYLAAAIDVAQQEFDEQVVALVDVEMETLR